MIESSSVSPILVETYIFIRILDSLKFLKFKLEITQISPELKQIVKESWSKLPTALLRNLLNILDITLNQEESQNYLKSLL